MIKVAITDDHQMVLTGLKQMLGEDPVIHVCGTYLSGGELMEGLEVEIPDVLLLDLQLPDIDGEDLAVKVLRLYPSVKILVLTSIDITRRVKQMMKLGCKGYSLKNISKESLLKAIETVYKGGEYLDPVIKEELLKELLSKTKPRASSIPDISRREKEVLALLSKGLSSKDIATQLYLSVRTVENHRKSLLQKFDVKNTAGVLHEAGKKGFL